MTYNYPVYFSQFNIPKYSSEKQSIGTVKTTQPIVRNNNTAQETEVLLYYHRFTRNCNNWEATKHKIIIYKNEWLTGAELESKMHALDPKVKRAQCSLMREPDIRSMCLWKNCSAWRPQSRRRCSCWHWTNSVNTLEGRKGCN